MQQEFVRMLAEAAFSILGAALGLAALVVLRLLVEYIKTRIGESSYLLLLEKGQNLVRGLEQQGVFAGWDGAYKKHLAMMALREVRDGLKLDWISDQELSTMIEGFVFVMNRDKPWTEAAQPAGQV